MKSVISRPLNDSHTRTFKGSNKYQSGAVLAISLIMMLLLTLIGITGMQTTGLEEKMAGNMRDRTLAFQAAESALSAAEVIASPTLAFVTTSTSGATNAATPPSSGYYSPTAVRPAIDTDAFWSFASNYKTYSGGTLVGISANPSFIIQRLEPADCPGSASGSLGCNNYRITARATGGSSNAVVMLQSVILK